jgi:glycosyltransferase involved in cell wall biosynthesis
LIDVPVPATADREQAAIEAAGVLYEAAHSLMQNEAIDLIYERYSLWSAVGARLARESGLPLVVEVNAPLRLEAARYRALQHAERAAEIEAEMFDGARTLAVVSRSLRDYVLGRVVDAERVQVVPNAVDECVFNPVVDGQAVRARLGLEGRFVIGFVGTVKPWHDLGTLLEALSKLRAQSATSATAGAFHLLLVGDIPAGVRDVIAQRGLTDAVTIVGPVPHAEVPNYIAAMDVAASPHPHLADFYFSPLKLFEYLACAVPTVAADVETISDIVTHGETALLYAPGNAAELAGRIAALAADRELRTSLGWRGADLVLHRHTWKCNAQQILGLLEPAHGHTQQSVPAPALPLCDARLRKYLFRATRADLVEPLLAAYLPSRQKHSFEALTRIEVLKYKPRRRCVIQYDLKFRRTENTLDGRADVPATQSVIGKVFKDERGAEQFAFHQTLWAEGFDAQAADGISIPQPLAYIPELRMFLQARAPGRLIAEAIRTPVFSEQVRASARAIAKLHSSQVQPAKRYTLDDELAHLSEWYDDIAGWHPATVSRLAPLRDALRAWARALPAASMAPAHCDFYYSQLLFAGDQVSLIDLDMFACADRALDVANFAAHVRFLSLQYLRDAHLLDHEREAFINAYARRLPLAPGFWTRLAFYEAATYFRLLRVILHRPQFITFFDAMLGLLEQALRPEYRPA